MIDNALYSSFSGWLDIQSLIGLICWEVPRVSGKQAANSRINVDDAAIMEGTYLCLKFSVAPC